jgi:tetratricopeptide (TPR) repeat protein
LIKSKNILLESIDLEKSFSEAYAALGMTYSLLGENDEAEEYLESGVELAEEHENIESLSLLYNYLGIYYRKLLNIKKSIKFFEKSLILQKKMNDRLMQANIYNNMSTCYTIKGNNEEALNLIFRAEDIYKTMNEEKKLANSYGNIGNIFANMDDYKNSIKYYDLAKSIFNLEEMYASYSQILILQAELYLNLDELSKAKVNLDESNNILSSFNIPTHQAYRYYLVAKILFKEQDFDEALDYIEDAIEIFEELNNKLKIGDLLILNAEIMIKLNKIKKAQRSLDKAEKICEKHNDKPLKDYLNKVKQKII